MWTIGYICHIEVGFIYITYSHCNSFIKFETPNEFILYEIVLIHLGKDEEIVEVQHYDDKRPIEFVYSYQSTLLRIVKDNFITGDFVKRIETSYSRLLSHDYLSHIIKTDDIGFLLEYINNIDIKNLAVNRTINIFDITDDEGNYKSSRVECTDFKDTYLNKLLYIDGFYSPTCVNNTPTMMPYKSFSDAVARIAKVTEKEAIRKYSKREHLRMLLEECMAIKDEFQIEQNNILKQANYYLNYPINKNCK